MPDTFETEIHWRDVFIGHLADWMPDMSYIEGQWVPFASEEAKEFTALVSAFDVKAVYRDLTKGTRIKLRYERDGKLHHGVAISINNGQLFLRRIFGEDAVQWSNENIPE